jgi:3-isopropylmalate/(R)-2-methylmalate dehydratase small subunit
MNGEQRSARDAWRAGRVTSRALSLRVDNIDTDQIIPARFLKTTSKEGLGSQLFHDWRYDDDGRPRPGFVLNQPGAVNAGFLLAGQNFGCGSSREHAPWALAAFGFRAVIALSFADIFRQNALKNGLLPIVMPHAVHRALSVLVSETPGAQLTVDLDRRVVILPGGDEISFPIDAFARECLLAGVDELGYVLAQGEAIARYERQRTCTINTLAHPAAST